MTVYVMTLEGYEEFDLLGVFASVDLAKRYAENHIGKPLQWRAYEGARGGGPIGISVSGQFVFAAGEVENVIADPIAYADIGPYEMNPRIYAFEVAGA